MYPTHIIYRALGCPDTETESYKGTCAFCGTDIEQGVMLENAISDAFTNFDLMSDRSASYVCKCCYTCLKETKLRKMNFVATTQGLTLFKRDQIEKYLFDPPETPFVFAVTESRKKHNSFKARVNFSQKMFYVQKEDVQIVFMPEKYKVIFDAMKRLYSTFSKTAIATGEYQQNYILKYDIENFRADEDCIKNVRGSLQFDLMIYAMNMSEENLKKFMDRQKKKENKQE